MKVFKNCLMVVGSIFVSLIFLKIIDVIAWPNKSVIFGGHYEMTDWDSVSQMEIYPYTGGHTQADYPVGKNFKTGDHGFMVNFDLDRPPPKASSEFRLIFTGGSGAAGWGASQPANFLSSVLERLFAERADCRGERRLRVINLAMGDSQSYQNYIALNRWAHALEPDMIMSYSGFNDINVPWFTLSDGYRNLEVIQAFNRIARHSKSPRWLKFVGRVYPGLVRYSSLGIAIRSVGIRNESAAAHGEYLSRFPTVEKKPSAVMERLAIPNYVHALKSMKRDFRGIPMVIAFQPYGLTNSSPTFRNYLADPNPEVVAFNKKSRLDVSVGIDRI